MNRDWAPWAIFAAAGGAAFATLVMKRKARYTPPKVWAALANGASINQQLPGLEPKKVPLLVKQL